MAHPPPGRAALSTRILHLLNFITFLLSIALLGVGIWLLHRHYGNCSNRLYWFLIAIAILIFIVSVIGLLGTARRSPQMLWVYIAILSVAVLLLLAFTIFAFVVKNHGFGAVIGAQLKDYDADMASIKATKCQGELLWALRRDWDTLARVSLVALIVVVVIYATALCAFRHAFTPRYY